MEAMSKNEHVMLSPALTRQKPEVSSHLNEDVVLVLSRWNGLQLAIQNGWGGHDSLQKSHHLVSQILSWFSQSKGRLHVEDLENLLHEYLLFSFNTEIEDGSIEEACGRTADDDTRRIFAPISLDQNKENCIRFRVPFAVETSWLISNIQYLLAAEARFLISQVSSSYVYEQMQ